MRKLLVTLDDELDKVLAGKINQNEIVREALRLYNGNISTDTLTGMRVAFEELRRRMQDLEQRFQTMEEKFTDQYDLVERLTNKIEELTYR